MEYVSDLCQWGLLRMHWKQLWICLTGPPFRHCVCELSYILKDDKFEYNGKLHDLVTFPNFRIVFGIIQIHNVLICPPVILIIHPPAPENYPKEIFRTSMHLI